MATMTVSLPDPLNQWIETRVVEGDYASASDYVRDLVRRDRDRLGGVYSLDEIRGRVAEARASGTSSHSIADIRADGVRIAKARGWLNEPG